MAKGTYTIVLNLPEAATLAIGALGEFELPGGWYAYTGSAFGPGGFSRVDRHHRVAAGDHDARHWHIDYLLGDTNAEIATVVRTNEADIECAVARNVSDQLDTVPPVDGFGASDCDCPSHLQYTEEREPVVAAVRSAHGEHAPES